MGRFVHDLDEDGGGGGSGGGGSGGGGRCTVCGGIYVYFGYFPKFNGFVAVSL